LLEIKRPIFDRSYKPASDFFPMKHLP
jgi:hypothetical protein